MSSSIDAQSLGLSTLLESSIFSSICVGIDLSNYPPETVGARVPAVDPTCRSLDRSKSDHWMWARPR